MYSNDKKSKFGPLLTQIFFTILAVSLILAFSFPLSKKLKKQYTINKEIKQLKEEINEEESRNTSLKKFIEYLDSDQYTEEKARTNLNYKNENEVVVVVKDNIAPRQNPQEETFTYTSNSKEILNDTRLENINNWFNYFLN
jgi:cell division protein FtsB